MGFSFIERMFAALSGKKAIDAFEPTEPPAVVSYKPAPESAEEPDDLLDAILALIANSEEAQVLPAAPFDSGISDEPSSLDETPGP